MTLLYCHTQQELQDMTNRLHVFGKKSWATYQWREDESYDQTTSPITLEGQNIEKVDKFQYLGS